MLQFKTKSFIKFLVTKLSGHQKNKMFFSNKIIKLVAWLQSVYYIITGIWPLVSISTFIQITGPKTDIWLVKTVGLLITVIGVTIFSSVLYNRITKEIITLGILSIFSLSAIDFYYSWADTISNIYLLDVFAEFILLLLWLAGIYMHSKK